MSIVNAEIQNLRPIIIILVDVTSPETAKHCLKHEHRMPHVTMLLVILLLQIEASVVTEIVQVTCARIYKLQLSIALDPAVEVGAVVKVDDEQLVEVDLLLVGAASAVESAHLLALDLREGVPEDAAGTWIMIVKVHVEDLEELVLGLSNAEEVVRIRQEDVRDDQ